MNNKFLKLLTILFILTIGFSNAAAQEKEISEEEFKKIHNAWKEKEKTLSYRSKTKYLVKQDGFNITDKTIIREVESPDRYHLIEISNLIDNTPKVETIKIGKNTYRRENEEKWEKNKKPRGRFIQRGKAERDYQKHIFTFLGTEEINGQETKVYLETSIYTIRAKEINFGSNVNELIKYWFNEEGLLLKYESGASIETFSGNKSGTYSERFYDFNVEIKIEKPSNKKN